MRSVCYYSLFSDFIAMARVMKTIRFLLLTAFFISIIYYTVYRYCINLPLIKNCNQAWDELNFNIINDSALKEVFDICNKDDIALNGSSKNSNNYYLLKHSLKTFNCSRTLRTLDVERPYVALASFPGSGNTWTRFLLEAVTGIETGSIYKDKYFAGSQLCPARGKVFIVKTHRHDNSLLTHSDCREMRITRLKFSSAIYIIRNPYNAILAEFNRPHMWGSKLRIAPKESFNTTKWRNFVKEGVYKWKVMTLKWLQRKDIPVFVLTYERLIENVVLEIYNLTKFLNYKMKFKHIYCLSNNMTRKYKREKTSWLTKANLYDYDLREVVNSAVEFVKDNLHSKRNISNVLDSYILPVSNRLK